MDQKTRKPMMIQKGLDSGKDIDRHYVSSKGGRRLASIEDHIEISTQGLTSVETLYRYKDNKN